MSTDSHSTASRSSARIRRGENPFKSSAFLVALVACLLVGFLSPASRPSSEGGVGGGEFAGSCKRRYSESTSSSLSKVSSCGERVQETAWLATATWVKPVVVAAAGVTIVAASPESMDPITVAPTSAPVTSHPTTKEPTFGPTKTPTMKPTTKQPTFLPTKTPTMRPTTRTPTVKPTTKKPTYLPTRSPTMRPTTRGPTFLPTKSPTTSKPSRSPTRKPTTRPTGSPSTRPTTSRPTAAPSTSVPTVGPSVGPTTSMPTGTPTTSSPSQRPTTSTPTTAPSVAPTTSAPTNAPRTSRPTVAPTTSAPSSQPTTSLPTLSPTTVSPTFSPSVSPSRRPTTQKPTKAPTTSFPTKAPATSRPTKAPVTTQPSRSPTVSARRRTPWMGFSTWEVFGSEANAASVLQMANFIKSSGLHAAGYTLMHLDDGWQKINRSTGWVVREKNTYGPYVPGEDPGCIVHEESRYPHGMAHLSRQLTNMGFHFGMYTSGGDSVCNFKKPHWYSTAPVPALDAQCFMKYNVSLLKIDKCVHVPMSDAQTFSVINEFRQHLDPSVAIYNCRMNCMAPVACNVPYVCPWNVRALAGKQVKYDATCSSVSDLHRVSLDIHPDWRTILRNANALHGHGQVSSWSNWADGDFLVPFNSLTRGEKIAQFAMWTVMSSPLLISSNLLTAPPYVIEMLKTPEAIWVDQTYEGDAGDRFMYDPVGLWGFRKRFPQSGITAVTIVNLGGKIVGTGHWKNPNLNKKIGVQKWNMVLKEYYQPSLEPNVPNGVTTRATQQNMAVIRKRQKKAAARAKKLKKQQKKKGIVTVAAPQIQSCRVKLLFNQGHREGDKVDKQGWMTVSKGSNVFKIKPRDAIMMLIKDCQY